MATVDETMMRVQRILTGPMELMVTVKGDRFSVSFQEASTEVFLRVMEWLKDPDGNPQTVVILSSPILLDVTPTPELFEWVAREGGSQMFGHVEVHDVEDSNTVNRIMSHTLLGDYLDEPELAHAFYGVFSAANHWDDELQPKFGGQRLRDA